MDTSIVLALRVLGSTAASAGGISTTALAVRPLVYLEVGHLLGEFKKGPVYLLVW